MFITHPDNLQHVKRILGHTRYRFAWPPIKTSPYMERDKPTGRYILRGGVVVDRAQVRVVSPFVEYGPEDVEYLVLAGVIKEEREPLFYEVRESLYFDPWPETCMSRGPWVTTHTA